MLHSTYPCQVCGTPTEGRNRLALCSAQCRRIRKNHSNRKRRRDLGQLATPGSCRTCGAPTMRRSVRAIYPRYCPDGCHPACDVAECGKPMKYHSNVGRLCGMHYQRWRTHGDPSVTLLIRDLSEPTGVCKQCAGPCGNGYGKWFCSVRCFGRYRRGIDERAEWPCRECGRSISVQDSRQDAKRCKRCRSIHPCMTVLQLAERDGANCGICREPVTVTASGRDLLGPVVDHIRPRAHGGLNTPGNVQLAHMVCNSRKQDRIMG